MFAPKYPAGTIIKFTYNEDVEDIYKEVFVLHPSWNGKIHGIDLKRLTPAEVKVIEAIFDPSTKDSGHPYPLVNDIIRRMDPVEEIKNPLSFYHKFVKVFLRNKDAYRQYWPHKMVGVVIVKKTSVAGHVINPKPLFRK